MPNVMTCLKQEITRLARKEVRAALIIVKKDKLAVKRRIIPMQKDIALLKKELRLQSRALTQKQDAAAPAKEEGERVRITAKGVKALRRKLRLSQALFAKLLGVSALSVFKWENKAGKVEMRSRARTAFLRVRALTPREAVAALEQAGEKSVAPGKRRAARRRKRQTRPVEK